MYWSGLYFPALPFSSIWVRERPLSSLVMSAMYCASRWTDNSCSCWVRWEVRMESCRCHAWAATLMASSCTSGGRPNSDAVERSEEHTSELQSPCNLVCRLLLEKKKKKNMV